jgi:hypothetical protein
LKKLLIISCYDSFLKGSFKIAETFEKHDYIVDYYIYNDYRAIDQNHFSELGFKYPYKSGLLEKLFQTTDIFHFDAIMLSMEGPSIYKFIKLYNRKASSSNFSKRPILFSGYIGIVYENYVQGFLDRQALDVFYVNSKHDLTLFTSYCKTIGIDHDNITLTGLPMLDAAYNKKFNNPTSNNDILFACQPTVPKRIQERIYIVQRLIAYAKKFPERKVYFKPRHKPNQSTFHIVLFHYQDIINSIKRKTPIPENFILTYEPIQEILNKVDFCLTISSTASFEALCMGKKVGFIADFGIAEKYGNHYFLGSDCLITFNDLMLGRDIVINKDWERNYFKCDGRNSERVFIAVEKLIDRQRTSSKMFPIKQSFKDQLTQKSNFMPKKSKRRYFIVGRIREKVIIFISRIISKAGPALFMKIFPS